MSESSVYARRILSGRNFRLLFLHPAFDQNEQLECSCLPFEIDAAPPFEALSYVWGPPEPTAQLSCNGFPFTVREELVNALRKLRLRGSTRIVWADAICINQDDIAERNHQVPLMGSIYSSARRVVVWLGHGDLQQIQEAFRCITYIAMACRQDDIMRNRPSSHDERHGALILPESQFPPAVCSGLQELFERPWFSRIWCVQEIHLARDALVLCGDHQIPWEDLALGISWIFDKISGVDEYASDIDPVIRLLKKVDIGRPDMMCERKEYPVLETLHSYREFNATNGRDKVYGVFNLVSPRSEIEVLNVNYDKSIAEVFADTVLTTIKLSAGLSALAYITHLADYDFNSDDEYRSWAPRWDNDENARVLGAEKDCPWKTCGQHCVIMSDKDNLTPKQLSLKGVIYRKVIKIEESMEEDNLVDPGPTNEGSAIYQNGQLNADTESQSDKMHPFIRVWRILNNAPLNKSDILQRLLLFARTISPGTFGRTDAYLEHLDSEERENFIQAFFHVMHRLEHLYVSGREGGYQHYEESSQFQRDAYYTCKHRCMFWTEHGSLGLGPHCMDADDIVVVLFGGNTPYVLRPRGDRYLFMGQAYVDDIMDGQVVRDLRAGRRQEQVFCLI